MENSRHREDTCKLCVDEKQTSRDHINNIKSPKTSCHIDVVIDAMKKKLGEFFGFHGEGKTCKCSLDSACELPFPVGEVSGQYITVGAAGLDVMLAHAIKIARALFMKENNYTGRKEILNKLGPHLLGIRAKLWWNILVYGVPKSLDNLDNKNMKEMLSDPVNELKVHSGPVNVWWKALMQTVSFIIDMNLELSNQFLDVSSMEDPMYRNFKQVYDYNELQIRNQLFISENNLWPKFKLWPTLSGNSLVILLPDKTHCQTCKAPLTGECAIFHEGGKSLPSLMPRIGENGELVVVCPVLQNPRCISDYFTKDVKLSNQMDEEKLKIFIEELAMFTNKGRDCDMCLKKSLFSHRCSECHAAQYCSTHCQVKDLEFHKTVCSTWANDKSKKIISSKHQKKIYKSMVDKYLEAKRF